jgi:hypothetical protein
MVPVRGNTESLTLGSFVCSFGWHFVGDYRTFPPSMRSHSARCAARVIWAGHDCGLYVSSAGLDPRLALEGAE